MTVPGENVPFYKTVLLASAAGAAGGFVGTPADMINVRMQNDVKLPLENRRKYESSFYVKQKWNCILLLVCCYSYKHAFDGMLRVWREEGFTRLFSGASTATMRAVLMTVGQLSFYDQVKQFLLASGYFGDNSTTHFLSSLTAVNIMQIEIVSPM